MKATANIITADIQAAATEIAQVLEGFKVFWRESAALDKEAFVREVVRFAQEPTWGYLELTYSESSVRLIIKVENVDGRAQFKSIDAYDHPYVNPKMDYEKLNVEMKAVQNITA